MYTHIYTGTWKAVVRNGASIRGGVQQGANIIV